MTRLTEPEVASTRIQRAGIPGLERIEPRTPSQAKTSQAAPSKRLSKAWLLLPVGIAALTAAGWYGVEHLRAAETTDDVRVFEVEPMSFPVILTAKGEVKAKKNTELRCEVEGRSTIVWLIEEGKQVEKGDLLVELANDGGGAGLSIDDRIKKQEIEVATAKSELESQQKSYEIQLSKSESNIRKAELDLELAELNLNKYIDGTSVQTRESARLECEEAEALVKRRQAEYETSKELYEKKYITWIEHENNRFAAYKAEIELQKSKRAEEILEKYTHVVTLRQLQSTKEEAEKDLERTRKSEEAEIAQQKSRLEAKKALYEIQLDKLEKLKEQRENLKIYAPGPGMVVYHRSGRYWDPQRIEVGSTVHERQVLIDLPDPSVMQIEVKINESQMDKVEPDLPATAEVDRIPGVRFTGSVTKIGVLADAQHRWLNPNLKEYTNEITLDQAHPDLKPGMSATVEILITQLEDVLAVPVQCIFTKGGHSFVFLADSDEDYREVKLGLASTEYVEVKEGLSPGDKVLLAIDEDTKRKLPTDINPGDEVEARRERLRAFRGGKKPEASKEAPKRGKPSAAEASRDKPEEGVKKPKDDVEHSKAEPRKPKSGDDKTNQTRPNAKMSS